MAFVRSFVLAELAIYPLLSSLPVQLLSGVFNCFKNFLFLELLNKRDQLSSLS